MDPGISVREADPFPFPPFLSSLFHSLLSPPLPFPLEVGPP